LEELLKLDEFKKYLGAIGLPVPDKLPSVKIITNTDNGAISYYDLSQQQIVIQEQATKDPSVVLREYMHYVLYRQRDGHQIPDDRMNQLYPIESFMAFYIPASFLNNPKIGNVYTQGQQQDYLYDLQGPSDIREYDKLKPEERPYRGAEIVGRLFWDFRQAVGRDTADKFIVAAWKEYSSRSAAQSLKEFLSIFEGQFEQGPGAIYVSKVKGAYQAHGVQL
jgi:hypothetical protein